MTTQTRFLRRAEVTVSRGGSQVLKADESLRIVFNIRRDAAPETQPSTIALYNLAFETRQLIQEQDRVRLSAGYANTELALVAEGDIRRIDHERSDLDRISVIAIGQSDIKLASLFNRSYKTVALTDVVLDIVADMGLTVHYSIASLPAETLPEFAYIGRCRDALTELLQPRNFRWYEFMGQVAFATVMVGQNLPTGQVEISEATGMVGTPVVTEKGVRARVLLDPQIEPNAGATIISENVNGDYTIISVSASGRYEARAMDIRT